MNKRNSREIARYSGILWGNNLEAGNAAQYGTPIPREIINFYIQHGYGEKNIPLNADTCRKIAELMAIQEMEQMRR